MAKTHYCGIDYPNESDNSYYYSPTACGLEYCESPMTDKVKEVTCKNCLRVLEKAEQSASNCNKHVVSNSEAAVCLCESSSWNRDAGCFVCDECGERI